ncbi:protocadherin beta-15 isoform X1 [Argonauta hians]
MLVQLSILLFTLRTCMSVDLTYNIYEGKSPGTYIGDIAADTKSYDKIPSKDHSQITFSQLQQDSSTGIRLFNVSKSGRLYTVERLDAEAICKYNVECFKIVEVAVKQDESFIKILEVKVIINDANDNAPEFPVKMVELKFSEGDGEGMKKFIPNAIDKDVGVHNSQINYNLRKNDNEDPFILSVSKKLDGTAKLLIILAKRLDRELKDTYMLEVIAKDGGSPTKQSILNVRISVIDVNDNPPVFTQNIYNVSLRNTHQISIPIAKLSATDLDSGKNGQISYHFSSKTSDQILNNFELDKRSGEIFLSESFSFQKRLTYALYVEARDEGNPPMSSSAILQVNVINQQNNAPSMDVKFMSESADNLATISEGVKVGSFIAYVKIIDNDLGQNGIVSCSLVHDKLKLQSLGKKKYKVVVKKAVDRETEKNINFMIKCQDRGFPSLKTERKFSIQITDVNDVRPEFTKDTFKFLTYENEEANFPVGFINATDLDLGDGGQLVYLLDRNNAHNVPFKISNNGFISTKKSFDREQQEIYKFKVLVRDCGSPPLSSSANVIVEVMDENDNAPYFTFPSVSPFSLDVHYHPQSSNDITTLRASDRDRRENAFLHYELFSSHGKDLFSVNPYTGVLSYSRPVYQNDAGVYELQFTVKDSGSPVLSASATLSLTLTVNNSTSTKYAAMDSQTDNKIHFNLFIIIVVATVTASVVLVVSIVICIIRRSDQRNVQYTSGVDFPKKLWDTNKESENLCEQITSQSDPTATVLSASGERNLYPAVPRGQLPSTYDSSYHWKGSLSRIPCQATAEETHQMCIKETPMTSDGRIDKLCTVISLGRSNELSTKSPPADNGQNWSNADSGLYEELPDVYISKHKQLQGTDKNRSIQVLKQPMDMKPASRRFYQTKVDHKNETNSLKKNSASSDNQNTSAEFWNLPEKNSFTSYSKPLPSVAKLSYA